MIIVFTYVIYNCIVSNISGVIFIYVVIPFLLYHMTSEKKVFDFRGMQCPIPILETSKAIRTIEVGGTIMVLANDPAAKSDLQAWSKRTGHQLLEINEKEEFLEFLLKRDH